MINDVFADRVCETTTKTGNGDTFSLGGAWRADFRTFANAFSDGDVLTVCVTNNVDAMETFDATFTGGAVVRTTQRASTNGGSKINWSAGEKQIFATPTKSLLDRIVSEIAGKAALSGATFTGNVVFDGGEIQGPPDGSANVVLTIKTRNNDGLYQLYIVDSDDTVVAGTYRAASGEGSFFVNGIIRNRPTLTSDPFIIRCSNQIVGSHFDIQEADGTSLFWIENHGLSGHHAHFGAGVDAVIAGDLSATDGAFSGNVSAATGRIGGLSGAAGGGEVFTVRTYEASGRAGLRLRGDGANNSNFGGMLFLKADGSESWHFALDTALTYGGGNDLGFRRWGQSVDTLKLGADGTSVLVSQSVAGANITVGFNTLQSFAYGGRNQLFYTGAIVGTQAFSMASVWGTLPSGADVWFELNQTSGMLFASNILTQWYDAAYIANVTNPDVSLRRLSAGTLEIAGANGAGAGHLSVKGTVRLGTYTDLTLPTAGAAGRIAYSSDSGLVYDDGTNWKKTTWSNV